MPERLRTYIKAYHGATGPSRVPLGEAVWAVIIRFRGNASNNSHSDTTLTSHLELSKDTIAKIQVHVDRALLEMVQSAKPTLQAICRERAKYVDRTLLSEALAEIDTRERRLRRACLNELRNSLPRAERRRLLAWIAHELRASMSVHQIDKRLFILTDANVHSTLERICSSVRA